jgi:hypothetical protein
MRGAAEVILLAFLAIGLSSTGVWLLYKNRRNPWEKEQKRREVVHRRGRMGDAFVTDVRDDVVYYTYEVRGVTYAASQDVSRLQEYLPDNFNKTLGHVALKYLPQNPANSILICEEWSGLRLFMPNSTNEQ